MQADISFWEIIAYLLGFILFWGLIFHKFGIFKHKKPNNFGKHNPHRDKSISVSEKDIDSFRSDVPHF